MATYAEMMDRLDLKVASPDKRILARLQGRDRLTVAFVPGAYEDYAVAGMERQLAGLAQLVWTGRRRAAMMARAKSFGTEQANEESSVTSDADRDFFEARREIETVAASPLGWVSVYARGWRHWRVEVHPKAQSSLHEREFTTEVTGLFPALMADYRAKYDELLADHHERVWPDRFGDQRPRR